jgi:outer membrane protein assembly factor BamB
MTMNQVGERTPRRPLRLWPGVAAAVLMVLVRVVTPLVFPGAGAVGVIAGVAGAFVILAWWLFFSRAPWSERAAAIGLMLIAVAATSRIVHPSISNGFMGRMLPIFAIPVMCLALVAWAVASRGLTPVMRRVSMAASILLACGSLAFIRTGGITGDAESDLHWRWTPTPEERLLAQGDEAFVPPPSPVTTTKPETPAATQPANEPAPAASVPAIAKAPEPAAPVPASEPVGSGRSATVPRVDPVVVSSSAEWPGFRGARRDGIVTGVRLNTDWSQTPPVELWRRPVGPGWSSFAVHSDLIYTQEQRGEDEVVSCYRLSTGEPVWRHKDPVRFWESNGGAGPRGTPTLHGGRVYTMGATGLVNVLDAGSGAVVWSRNAATDTGTTVPDWGIASSPLVVDDLVIVAVAGQLAAYDARTGNERWRGPSGGAGYSSPHLTTIAGVPQVVLLRGSRTISVAPADGTLLWEHIWQPGVGIVQPVLMADGNILIATGDGMGGTGMRRIAVAHGAGGWTAEERWTSRGLKPYFNDSVVHQGHAFGFDGSILACIDLETGERSWKGGRYGNGQMLLLPDQDLLLVLSEEGALALVRATADKFTEVAKFQAIEGKTWNHPVLIGDVLLVRNGEEMAAFRLPLAAGS